MGIGGLDRHLSEPHGVVAKRSMRTRSARSSGVSVRGPRTAYGCVQTHHLLDPSVGPAKPLEVPDQH